MNALTKSSVLAILAAVSLNAAAPAFAGADADNDGVPDVAEPLIHADPANADTDGDGLRDLDDDNAVFAVDPIDAGGAPTPFKVKEALVENNYDYAARKDATDHLELQVVNPTDTPLKDFSIYFTIEDKDTGGIEGYFKTLTGFSVPAGGDARIHFDDGAKPGHFRANPNSIYLTSQNAKLFTVELKAKGYKPVILTIDKDAGGAEEAD